MISSGKLLVAIGGNTNAGIQSCSLGDLPESPLSGCIAEADIRSASFNGNIRYVLRSDSTKTITDQVQGQNIVLAAGSSVKVHASGFRNPYDLVLTTKGKLYATDNGPNSGFGFAR